PNRFRAFRCAIYSNTNRTFGEHSWRQSLMTPLALKITNNALATILDSSFQHVKNIVPRFSTLPPQQPPIPPGVYIGKIVSAIEKISEAGNDLISMRVLFPDAQSLPCCLTFVPQARTAINAFCDSAQLAKPTNPDVEVELTATHCKGRYIY